ncbi:hypothetical protein REPUB_Repub14bG0070100 [Reevesia pubescens]
MESSLYQAALSGNVTTLDALLQEDELILDRASVTCFNETPLHIATMRGHLHFAASLLHRRPKLSNEFDALHRLPIHQSAVQGHAKLVELLLDINPKSLSVRDQDGKTTLHLAAMKGRVDAIKVLVIRGCDPESIEQRLYRGETTFHLCVRYNQLEAIKLLVETSNVNEEFVNVRDDDGNTILHLATSLKQTETVRYLVSVPIIKAEINPLNGMGFTALDLLERCPKDFKSLEIGDILMKVVIDRDRVEEPIVGGSNNKAEAVKSSSSWLTQLRQSFDKYMKQQSNWVEETQGSLMLVATLTATISFQVAFSPPGGVWQQRYTIHNETSCSKDQNGVCQTGTAVLAYVYPSQYFLLIIFATIAFFSSTSIVHLAISGLPLKNKVSTWLMTVAMIFSIAFTALTYLYSMILVIPDHMLSQANRAYNDTFYIWISLPGFIAVSVLVRLLLWLVRISPKFRTTGPISI